MFCFSIGAVSLVVSLFTKLMMLILETERYAAGKEEKPLLKT